MYCGNKKVQVVVCGAKSYPAQTQIARKLESHILQIRHSHHSDDNEIKKAVISNACAYI